MQVDEVLAFCSNAFSHFVYVRLVVCVLFLLVDCGRVLRSVSLLVCVFAALCVINK